MENKMYELMEKMYIDMQNGFEKIDSRIGRLETKVDRLELATLEIETKLERLKLATSKIETKLENETNEKVRALFDDREIQKEINDKVINTLDRIEGKIEVLQIETAHIRRVK